MRQINNKHQNSFQIIFTVTQQKNKLETIQWKKPRSQEAKKMKRYKRLIFKSQVFVTHSF